MMMLRSVVVFASLSVASGGDIATLSNGVAKPLLACGANDTRGKEAVIPSLTNGLNMIDTGAEYFNNQGVGEGVKEVLPSGARKREDILIRAGVEAFFAFISTPVGLLKFIAVGALATGIWAELSLQKVTAWVRKTEWWPRAMPLQKALMMNFGFPESALTEESTLISYSFVLVICSHHFLCGSMMLPVVIHGWTGAQLTGQACFVAAALMDVSYDFYDWIKMFLTTFCYETIGKKMFGGERNPVEFFIILGVLHHPLAMGMVCPLVMHYPQLASFHIIAVALLLAAGICFLTGAYKFTLDMTRKSDWYQFKAIVLLQTVTIFYTRGYIWFYHLYIALSTFWADGSMNFFYGGCAAGTLMSLFNFVMLADAAGAAVKWLPRKMAEKDSSEHEELQDDLVQTLPPTPSKGTMKGSLKVLGRSPASTFRTNVKVAVAVAKFKKGITKKE